MRVWIVYQLSMISDVILSFIQQDLIHNWKIPSSRLTLLYDKPPIQFQYLSLIERHEVLYRYFPEDATVNIKSSTSTESVLRSLIFDSIPIDKTPIHATVILNASTSMTAINLTPATIRSLPSFTRLQSLHVNFNRPCHTESSLFTILEVVDNPMSAQLRLRHDRPALLITSTSWTPDEDLDLLLESVCKYDAMALDNPQVSFMQ